MIRCVTQAGYDLGEGGKRQPNWRIDMNVLIIFAENFKHEKLDVDWAAAPEETDEDDDNEGSGSTSDGSDDDG